MLYILQSQEYDDFELHGIFEGQDGLDISKLRSDFLSQFDQRGLGKPEYPIYNGPTISSKLKNSSCCSGAIVVGRKQRDYAVPDKTSQEYEKWKKQYEKVSKDWEDKRKATLNRVRQSYPGENELEMFISYLKKDFGLHEVKCESVFI